MIATTFDLFYAPGYCVEVRALGARGNNAAWEGWSAGTVSGYFDDRERFVRAVTALDQAGPEGIYITLNPVLPDLLARATNRLRAAKRGETTHDSEIAARAWLLLDFDPVRPSGISSTQYELDLAYYAAKECWGALKAEHGEGIIAMSGNGIHLLYRLDAPHSEQTTKRLSAYLKEISQRFSTDAVSVDTVVFNASRGAKLYGTAARKGESTKGRPHRRSKLHKIPTEIGVVRFSELPAPPPVAMTDNREPRERIESALSVLPAHFGPNSYKRWLTVLMAVHSELGDAAVPLLEKYVPGNEGEIAAKCAGFQGNGTSISTLYAIAQEYGWNATKTVQIERYQDPEQVATSAEIESVIHGDLPFSIYSYRPEEGGILDAMLDHYGKGWRFLLASGRWHTWADTHWQSDQVGSIAIEIQTLLLRINEEAHSKLAHCDDKAEAQVLLRYISASKRTASRVSSIETMLRPHLTIDSSMNNKLNLCNGTLDLDTFAFTDHNRDDGMDYVLPYAYEPAAKCPRFVQFLQEILVFENTTSTDTELILLLQELLGYSLTTETNRQAMAWLSGEGNNGKSVLIAVIQALLGPMAVNIDFQVLGVAGNYDLADLPGKRVAFATEADASRSFADGILKRVVSGDRLRARHIMQRQFEFTPVAKVWWAMNDKPRVRYSHSIWRRLLLIPFYRVLDETEIDIYLPDTLLRELPGILNFALAGLQRLRQNNQFTAAAAVTAAKDEYALESSPIRQWVEERTEPAPFPSTPHRVLYEDYRAWCVKTGHQAYADTSFSRELKRMRIRNERRTDGRYYALNITGEKLTIEIPIGLGI